MLPSFAQSEFEVIFRAYDENVQFNYLRSFNRVRVTFSSVSLAEEARATLNNCRFQGTNLKVRPVIVSRNDCSLHSTTTSNLYCNKPSYMYRYLQLITLKVKVPKVWPLV